MVFTVVMVVMVTTVVMVTMFPECLQYLPSVVAPSWFPPYGIFVTEDRGGIVYIYNKKGVGSMFIYTSLAYTTLIYYTLHIYTIL